MLEAHITPNIDFSSASEIERFLRAVEIYSPELARRGGKPIYPTVIYDLTLCDMRGGKPIYAGDCDVFMTTHLENSNSPRSVFFALRPVMDFLHKIKSPPLRIKIKASHDFEADKDAWPSPYWEAHCEIGLAHDSLRFLHAHHLPSAHYSYNKLKDSGPWIASFRGESKAEIMRKVECYDLCSRARYGRHLKAQIEQVLFDNNLDHDKNWKYFGTQ